MTPRRVLAIASGAAIFLVISFLLARWLTGENRERDAIVKLLQAQKEGDAQAMLDRLDGCAKRPACARQVERNAQRLQRGRGDVRVVRIDSTTAHAITSKSGPARVAWVVGNSLDPVVQCIRVERRGVQIFGGSIVLTAIGPQIDGEASCPR